MNAYLESFLLVFGKNTFTNLRRYWTTFCYKAYFSPWNIVKISVLRTMAIKPFKAIKLQGAKSYKKELQNLQVRHFRRSRKTLKYENSLNFGKAAFCCLGFWSQHSILLCLYLELWFKQTYAWKTVLRIFFSIWVFFHQHSWDRRGRERVSI